jgi:hypothetical protein
MALQGIDAFQSVSMLLVGGVLKAPADRGMLKSGWLKALVAALVWPAVLAALKWSYLFSINLNLTRSHDVLARETCPYVPLGRRRSCGSRPW